MQVGVAAAVLIELVTDQGVFSSTGNAISNETAMAYAVTAACTLGIAGAAALARSSVQSGVEVLESVYASLTAVKRSAASVTQTQVCFIFMKSIFRQVSTSHDCAFCRLGASRTQQ